MRISDWSSDVCSSDLTYAIGVTLFGRQGFRHRGRQHVSTAGTIIAMNPDDAHDGGAIDEGGFGYWMLYPDAELWRDIMVDAGDRPAAPPFFADTLIRDRDCAQLLLRLCMLLTGNPADTMAAESAATDALLAVARRHGRAAPATVADRQDRKSTRLNS